MKARLSRALAFGENLTFSSYPSLTRAIENVTLNARASGWMHGRTI